MLRVETVPEQVVELARGGDPCQKRLAAGLRRQPRLVICGGVARVLVPPGSHAWTLGRTVFVAGPAWRVESTATILLIAHECVHVAQWYEQGTSGFLSSYVGAYLAGRFRHRLGHWAAYELIPAEVEAYSVQSGLNRILDRNSSDSDVSDERKTK